MLIPRVIHQTYNSENLPKQFQIIVKDLKFKNPDWEYRFYDNQKCSNYILENYGREIYEIYNSINPIYGAAKADLFRYLLLYKEGGVYLDIKSNCDIPLSELIKENDEFLLSSWPNLKGQEFYNAGFKRELRHIEGGEFQQWYIICKPNHPFLKIVIDRVIREVKNYNPWRHGIAKAGVLRLTGPIPYTLAINPLLSQYNYRYARSHNEFALRYTALSNHNSHVVLMNNHYSKSFQPIVKPKTKLDVLLYLSYIVMWGMPLFYAKLIYNKIFAI